MFLENKISKRNLMNDPRAKVYHEKKNCNTNGVPTILGLKVLGQSETF